MALSLLVMDDFFDEAKKKGLEYFNTAKDFYNKNKSLIHKAVATTALVALGLPALSNVFDMAFTAV